MRDIKRQACRDDTLVARGSKLDEEKGKARNGACYEVDSLKLEPCNLAGRRHEREVN